MYKIKQQPEDFVVIEKANIDLEEGNYAIYKLTKRNLGTMDAVKIISKTLRIPLKNIKFSGSKDKVAITEQYISILHGPQKDLESKDFSLKYLGQAKERLALGTLEANHFKIVVRNLMEGFRPYTFKQILNYFGKQRFGMDDNNHIIGRHIIKKQFKEAAKLIAESQNIQFDNNYIGIIRKLPKNLSKMYIHAYQSFIWNKAVSNYIAGFKHKTINGLNYPLEDIEEIKVPIVGFGTETDNDEIKHILMEEELSPRDFIIRSIPELSSEGGERPLLMTIKDLKIGEPEVDELNRDKSKITLEFTLSKGSYATILIDALFSD